MAHILIVDDEEMDRLLGRVALEDAGHQLLFAPNGEMALQAFKKNEIDLVITDLVMPNVNGLRLIQQIREEDGRALIIAVSGKSPEQLDRAEALGAARTMTKPYTAEDLLAAVTDLLSMGRIPPPDDLWR